VYAEAGSDDEEFSGPGRSEQTRQVFSKKPRVGRSITRTRRDTGSGKYVLEHS